VAADVLMQAPMCTFAVQYPRAQSGPKLRDWNRDESRKSFAIKEKVGGRDRDLTDEPRLQSKRKFNLSHCFGCAY
jgi:hypothetical protein